MFCAIMYLSIDDYVGGNRRILQSLRKQAREMEDNAVTWKEKRISNKHGLVEKDPTWFKGRDREMSYPSRRNQSLIDENEYLDELELMDEGRMEFILDEFDDGENGKPEKSRETKKRRRRSLRKKKIRMEEPKKKRRKVSQVVAKILKKEIHDLKRKELNELTTSDVFNRKGWRLKDIKDFIFDLTGKNYPGNKKSQCELLLELGKNPSKKKFKRGGKSVQGTSYSEKMLLFMK